MQKIVIIILLSLLFCSSIVAQENVFSEGKVVFDITLDPPDNSEGLRQHKGSYTILVKGNMIRKELVLDNGFRDINIYNADSKAAYSLRSLGSKYYAIELDMNELEEEYDKWRGGVIKDNNGSKKILDINAQKATITYKQGNTCDFYYSTNWKPVDAMFNYFPDIEVMPMSFVITNGKGMNMYFEAQSIKIKAIESAHFKIPKNYKIVTTDEYKQMR